MNINLVTVCGHNTTMLYHMLRHYKPIVNDFFVIIYATWRNDPIIEETTSILEEFNLKPFGSRALMSMRLEKNWGAWTLDFRPDFTAKESGLDFFIDWNKDFIGKESAKKDNSKLKLTPLIVETEDIDVTNNEAVVKDGKSIGYITSGGFAHHVKKSVAYSYLDEEILKTNEKFQVEINGNFYNCSIIKEPLYDPRGTKMRS